MENPDPSKIKRAVPSSSGTMLGRPFGGRGRRYQQGTYPFPPAGSDFSIWYAPFTSCSV
jgi:hypothetical protein